MSEQEYPSSVDVYEFNNVNQLFDFLDNEIKRRKAVLGDIIRDIEKLKTLSEAAVKLEQIFAEIAGGQRTATRQTTSAAKLNGVEVYINPEPLSETSLLTSIARGLQTSIASLEKVRKALSPLSKLGDIDLNIRLIIENGTVKAVVIKVPSPPI
ncbi:hypothetical protein APE_1947 [Aeropyrum pernix K1]|uniref:Uncharacterized protein n=1 Tax=Aeropyrum pernix (strain ATCC 700893 / DSM 11879 / JCM 9820 / NBRC 100138 / K1) TaxID=272557 RepID=Q9YAJ3_AERPE|nr:hypothetical protein [Aeropyrum pernix]BAA80956.1 hypothetical protein APE_1947 [Aeropyrum pernix K1]